jgi:hypothetical protein
MVDKEALARLNVTLTMKRKNGAALTVSTLCGAWAEVEKFLSDFEDTLLKGNNGQT